MTNVVYLTRNSKRARRAAVHAHRHHLDAHEIEQDMRLTGRVCGKLAGLRFRVAEIAETAMNQAPAATPRDLLGAWPKLCGGELGARL